MSHLDLISDHSKEKLVTVPRNVLDMNNLKMLFLEGNFLTKLPDDLFWKLPKLMWLDLRNNLLESLPTSIAFHEKLENLLLSNNNLERLPNELGTVPNLKALQVTENPLIYPERKVIMEGTKAIKNFLKAEYDQRNKEEEISDKITELDELSTIQTDDENEEQFIQNVEPDEIFPDTPKSIIEITDEEETKTAKLRSKISDDQCVNPDLEVKKLLPPLLDKKKEPEPTKIVHKISRAGSKIYLKSSITKSNKNNGKSDNKKFNNLKDGWLNELRILLNDQERILQQERNLRTISKWRLKRKNESEEGPKVFHGDLPKPPYDTDPEYNRMPTREELARTLNEFKEKGFPNAGDIAKNRSVELQRMIKNVMDQLKEMEIQYDPNNPSTEKEQADKQIKTMMDIQKKLMSLKSVNDTTL